MRLIQHSQSPEVQAAIARARAKGDPLASFGVGGGQGGCTPRATTPPGSNNCPPPPQMPGCIRPGRTCDVNRVGVTTVIQGGSAFTLTIEPTKVPWFQPMAVRATITDLASSDLSHRVIFTAVNINDTPQESINNRNPVAPAAPVAPATQGGSIDGWWSDDWIDPDGYAVPVGWGWISNDANLNVLTISGLALGIPATTNVLVNISLYGNGAGAPPNGMDPETAAFPTHRQPKYPG